MMLAASFSVLSYHATRLRWQGRDEQALRLRAALWDCRALLTRRRAATDAVRTLARVRMAPRRIKGKR